MNLFYTPLLTDTHQEVMLPELESKHATKVLRKKLGDPIQITNGKGVFAEAEIGPMVGKEIALKLLSKHNIPAKPYALHLYVAPTKMNDRYEWLLEKATEMGIDSITPIICEQSERKVIKPERYEKVLLSAMKQSLQSYLPTLHAAISLHKLLDMNFEGSTYIAHCEADQTKVSLSAQDLKAKQIHILIGPEGDFSHSEIQKALSKGFKAVSFGNTRLRTETAALYATAAVALQNESYER
ncbi:MAG: 16S rRNA (uracil(1498)-N(3))-methyltransferase [Flavobacteriia bacterium]|nr:16S rRNA (uracil(1498)-N(3))-methyltransferase [Flavobacteriia bacterium]